MNRIMIKGFIMISELFLLFFLPVKWNNKNRRKLPDPKKNELQNKLKLTNSRCLCFEKKRNSNKLKTKKINWMNTLSLRIRLNHHLFETNSIFFYHSKWHLKNNAISVLKISITLMQQCVKIIIKFVLLVFHNMLEIITMWDAVYVDKFRFLEDNLSKLNIWHIRKTTSTYFSKYYFTQMATLILRFRDLLKSNSWHQKRFVITHLINVSLQY